MGQHIQTGSTHKATPIRTHILDKWPLRNTKNNSNRIIIQS